jgi:hypothetical protein
MAKYLEALTRKTLKKHLEKSGIPFERELDKKTWYEFLTWSQIDLEKHETIITLDGWQDEFAEFDACYEDWKNNA